MDKNISKSIDFLRFPLAIAVVFLHLLGKYTNWSEHIILIQRFWSLLHIRLFYSNEIMCCITYLIMPFVISGVCVVFYNLLEKKCPKLLAQLTGARNLK